MPQKKNPDVLELVRAKYSIVLGYEFQLKNLINNLPSGYNRDLQLTKEPLMKGIETTEDCLKIMDSVSIPVMAKARIGHFGEAQILEAIGIDYIDESEVLTPADEKFHIDKWKFKVPFVCGATNLGEALRRIGEGAAMVRTKGEAGTGDVVEAVRHMRNIKDEMARIAVMPSEELMTIAKEMGAPYDLVKYVRKEKALPVVNFSAGGTKSSY